MEVKRLYIKRKGAYLIYLVLGAVCTPWEFVAYRSCASLWQVWVTVCMYYGQYINV